MKSTSSSIREQKLSVISDQYKSAYGSRPNLSRYSDLSDDELDQELDRLSELVHDQLEQEAERQQQDVETFQNFIQATIELGAGDRQTALRWIIEGEDIEFRGIMDVEGFLYRKGILFSSYGEELKEELATMFLN